MLEKDLIIVNKLGLHARAAAKLVKHASRYESEIWVHSGEKRVNAKSIMGILMLGATKGMELRLEVSGDDAEAALQDISDLINNCFGEDE